jgi:glycosyltransferase involved in cell wall biosynthesis
MSPIKTEISIGLPVYNGEKYLIQAIDSVLNQTFTDFELIIVDNASNDATQKICLDYIRKDSRIKYYRNHLNVGGPRNYNIAFELSSGKFFKWAAHDDILAKDYLEKCVQVLNSDSSIVLCHSKVGCIDQNGSLVGNYDDRTLDKINSYKPHERFADLISQRNTCWAIHGLMRTSCLEKTSLHGDYIDGDRNLLAELGLMGRIYEIPEHLFFRRDHPGAYTSTYYSKVVEVIDYRKQLAWWTGKPSKAIIVLPHWKNMFEYFKSINRVRLKISERFLCYRELSRWFLKGTGWELMRWDLINELRFRRSRLRYGKLVSL